MRETLKDGVFGNLQVQMVKVTYVSRTQYQVRWRHHSIEGSGKGWIGRYFNQLDIATIFWNTMIQETKA